MIDDFRCFDLFEILALLITSKGLLRSLWLSSPVDVSTSIPKSKRSCWGPRQKSGMLISNCVEGKYVGLNPPKTSSDWWFQHVEFSVSTCFNHHFFELYNFNIINLSWSLCHDDIQWCPATANSEECSLKRRRLSSSTTASPGCQAPQLGYSICIGRYYESFTREKYKTEVLLKLSGKSRPFLLVITVVF